MSAPRSTPPDGRRAQLERAAVGLFATAALTMAVICGSVIVAGWFAGVIDNRFEELFWAGAITAFVAVVVLGTASMPGGADDAREVRRLAWTLRVGVALFLVAPVLCLAALIADYYG